MLKAEKKLSIILKKCNNTGVTPENLINLQVSYYQYWNNKYVSQFNYKRCIIKLTIVIGILYLLFVLPSFQNTNCLMRMPSDLSKIFRKSENCMICAGITEVQRVKNISRSDFEKIYSKTGLPVVISDGALTWPAIYVFNFNFFKQLYTNNNEYKDAADECQFFPYKTEFKSLSEVFNMTAQRARLEPNTEPWYIGWSNCNNQAGKILRNYYSRPYFLPKNSENIALAWIFMGGPGNGAHMHVDNVVYPSWQAQLKGRKLWYLMPPPECIYRCVELSVTVHPGEIFVIDTNRWYHQTTILEGEVSITIGSEFD